MNIYSNSSAALLLSPQACVRSDQLALADQVGLCHRALRWWAPGALADRALGFAVPRLMSLLLLCGVALAGASSLVG